MAVVRTAATTEKTRMTQSFGRFETRRRHRPRAEGARRLNSTAFSQGAQVGAPLNQKAAQRRWPAAQRCLLPAASRSSMASGPGGCLHQHLSSRSYASASRISCTPAVGSAILAHGGSGLADTVDHYPAHATALTNLHDHVIGLNKRRWHHCLRRCCDG